MDAVEAMVNSRPPPLEIGDTSPTPMFPDGSTTRLSVGAPGRILNGIRELALLTSRTKKLASLPATSHVCAVKPLLPSCWRRSVGVSPSTTCSSTTGLLVPRPIRPPSST